MKTAIIIPSKTASLLEGCLGALKMTTPGIDEGETEIFIVANGTPAERSDLDGLIRTFRGHCRPTAQIVNVEVTPNYPMFYGNLCHAGAVEAYSPSITRTSPPKALVFLNDDTYAGTGWLDNLHLDMKLLKESRYKVGLLGCRGPNVSGPQDIFSPIEIAARQKIHKANPERILDPRPVVFTFPRIVTFACMVETEAYFAVGGFDLNLPAHNFSDDILSYRFIKAGYHNFISGSFVSHLGSRTVARGTDLDAAQKTYEADLAAGEKYYAEKYPDRETVGFQEMKWAGYA